MYKKQLTNNLGILFIHASGCPHCTTAKPIYSSLVPRYPTVTFEDSEMNDELYAKCIEWLPSEHVVEERLFSDGTRRKAVKLNSDGSLFKHTPMAFPSFLFFNKEGFIGHVVGADEKQLVNMLDVLLEAVDEQAS